MHSAAYHSAQNCPSYQRIFLVGAVYDWLPYGRVCVSIILSIQNLMFLRKKQSVLTTKGEGTDKRQRREALWERESHKQGRERDYTEQAASHPGSLHNWRYHSLPFANFCFVLVIDCIFQCFVNTLSLFINWLFLQKLLITNLIDILAMRLWNVISKQSRMCDE